MWIYLNINIAHISFKYHLPKSENGNQCVSVNSPQVLENCAETDGTSNQDICIRCNSGYYVRNGVCSERTTILNCLSYKEDEDRCEICENGYFTFPELDDSINGITPLCVKST